MGIAFGIQKVVGEGKGGKAVVTYSWFRLPADHLEYCEKELKALVV